MSILITFFTLLLFVFISKKIFSRWINPLFVYSIIWGVMIISYEMKLMPYIPLSNHAWLVIITAYLFFFLGILTVYLSWDIFKDEEFKESKISINFLFLDGGKKLNHLIWFLAILGLFAAVHHWMLLFEEYGSLTEIFVHSVRVYRNHVEGKSSQGVPYIWLASYIGLFLGALLSAHKGKLTLPTFLAILGIVLKEMARFTRSGILLGLLQFIFAFLLYRNMVENLQTNENISKRKMVFTLILALVLLVGSASFIKVSRNIIDSFQGTSKSLSQHEGGSFISPSIYLYMSSHIGVLSMYLYFGEEEDYFAQNILQPFYNFLALGGITQKTGQRTTGYYIPYWTNSGSYLRDIHKDLGFFGIILFPYIIGGISIFLWRKVMIEKNLYALVFLVYIMMLIGMSFFSLTMKSPTWTLNLILLLLIFKFFEKYNFEKK